MGWNLQENIKGPQGDAAAMFVTSETVVSITTGSHVFSIDQVVTWGLGQTLILYQSQTSYRMEGYVTAYNPVTFAMTIQITKVLNGSGSYGNWDILVCGQDGLDGSNGTNGTRGSLWSFKAGVPTSGSPTALAGDICVNSLTNDLYSTSDGTTWTKQFTIAGDTIPIGTIVQWSGTIASIPSGWGLCDGGTHDGQTTPDLRNKFVVGADADVSGVAKSTVRGAAAQTGGEATHRLQVGEIGVDAHTHNGVYAGYSAAVGTSLANMVLGTTSTYVNDSSQMAGRIGPTTPVQAANAHENTPPWYALAYIMRTVQTAPSSAAIPAATDSVAGLMSAADKTKIDGMKTAYARAYATATQTLAAGNTWYVAALNSVAAPGYNDGAFSTTNHNYVCPVAGRYHVDGMANMVQGGYTGFNLIASVWQTPISTGVAVEASRGTQQIVAANTGFTCQVSDTLLCAAGDILDMRLFGAAGAALQPGAALSHLTIELEP